MSFYLFFFIISIVATSLPFFIYKDVSKPHKLLVINMIIIATLLVSGIMFNLENILPPISIGLMSTIGGYILLFIFFVVPGMWILSFVAFILEIFDKKNRKIGIVSAMWSTSFLALLSISSFIFFLIAHADI